MNLSQKVAFNTGLLVVSRLAVAASGLVGVIVATRYLGVEDFGQLVTAVTYASLFGLVTDVGVWTIAAREAARHPEDEERILTNAFTIGLGLSLLAISSSLGIMFLIYGGGDRELVRLGILILVVQMVPTAIGGTTGAYVTVRQRAVPSATAAVLSSALFLAALAVVTSADLGFSGIASAFALSGLLNALVPYAFVARVAPIRPGFDREMARRLVRWALPQGAVLAVGVLYFRIDTVLLSLLAGDREVALYGVAYRVIEFLTLVPTFAMATLFPELARCEPHSDRLRLLMQGAFSALLLATAPVLLVFAGFAPEIVRIAGGPVFDPAAEVLVLLVCALVPAFITTTFLQALVALDQQNRLVGLILVALVVNVALNLLLVPELQAMGAAVALLVSEVLLLILARRLFKRVGAPPRLQRPLRLAGAAAIGLAFVLLLRALVDTGSHPILSLGIGGTLTLAVFAAAAYALRVAPVEVTSAIAQLRRT